MPIIDVADLKLELFGMLSDLELESEANLLTNILNGVSNLFRKLSDRMWDTATYTEYLSIRNQGVKKIRLRELGTSSITTIHDDATWVYAVGSLIAATNYALDAQNSVVSFKTALTTGVRNIKVVYVAGYTTTTLPADIKQVLLRQMALWYKQTKSSQISDSGKTILDEFTEIVKAYRYNRAYKD